MIQCIDIVYTSIFMCIYYVYVSCVSREEPEYSEWKHSTHTHTRRFSLGRRAAVVKVRQMS